MEALFHAVLFLGMKFDMGNIHQKSLKISGRAEEWKELRKLHREGRYAEEPICKECKVSRDGEFEQLLSLENGVPA